MTGRKSKINRNTMFYSDADFELEQEIGMDYIEQDINQTIVLFRVDRKSMRVNLYGETIEDDDVAYKEPVELNVLFSLSESTNKTYEKGQNLGRYMQAGNLRFTIYEKTLSDNDVDISYGDYVGLQVNPDTMIYFVVSNDGKINYDNKHTMYGTRAFYRTIDCVSVDKTEFNGI